MNLTQAMQSLSNNAQRIKQLAANVSDEQATWQPDPASWSILETVTHLLDEEREDFRPRLDVTLHQPGEPWPATDPMGWVTSRNYNGRILSESLADFLEERENSIAWLNTLDNPNWQAEYMAHWGAISAAELLASWVAHDLLHMRQLAELHYLYWAEAVRPLRILYAGEWE